MNTNIYLVDRSPVTTVVTWPNAAFVGAVAARDIRESRLVIAPQSRFDSASKAFVGTASKAHTGTGVAMTVPADRPPREAPC